MTQFIYGFASAYLVVGASLAVMIARESSPVRWRRAWLAFVLLIVAWPVAVNWTGGKGHGD